MNIHDKGPFLPSHRLRVGAALFLVFSVLCALPLQAARAMRPLEIKQRYARVLGTLAAGGLDQALPELVGLEEAAAGSEQTWRYVDNLWRTKLHVIRDLLASGDVNLLMPIIMLHHEAYFRYSEADRRHLAQHSRTMASELAEIFAERSDSPAARSFAGWTLTSFAAYLWSPSNIGMSADLFYRATLVDPANELALEGLAAAWERNGDYDKAMATLARALRLQPADPELSLRLALCHLRSPEGKHERARQQLAALTGVEAPAWVRSVAFQELARIQLLAEGPGTAEATLRQGLKVLPGDQQLSLQLAAILDGQRRRGEAIAVLDGIEIGGWERESSRQTYDFWEPPDLGETRAELHREMVDGQASLAAALKVAAAGGGGA